MEVAKTPQLNLYMIKVFHFKSILLFEKKELSLDILYMKNVN